MPSTSIALQSAKTINNDNGIKTSLKKTTHHPKGSLDRLVEPLGIKLVSLNKRRKLGQCHARATLKAIRQSHDDGFLVFILRVIRQTNGNRDALQADIIGAISDIFDYRPEWMELGSQILDIFDEIDLADLRKQAMTFKPWPVRATLRILLYQQLERLIHVHTTTA